ncbi:hypothetical protein V8F33_009389 [Rhypophila sp. PSN 637]
MHVPIRDPETSTLANDSSGFGILADILIPGRGQPISKAALIVKDDIIEWVGPESEIPAQHQTFGFSRIPVLMPIGMWDVHTHFMGADIVAPVTNFVRSFLPGTAALIGAVTVDDPRATLMAGFTSVRELGGYAGDVFPAVEKGAIVGPNVYSSMGILGITGGHSDIHELPLSTVKDGCSLGVPTQVCDGVDGCTSAVRQMVRRGAKVIKICSTGGVLSLNDQPEDSQFSPAELRAIVEEAARSSRVVASHAIGKKGIMAALEAGVKTIEHGMYVDEEVISKMKEKDAILVPTRPIVEGLAAGAEDLPPKVRVKVERLLQLSRDSLKLAVKRRLKIALGTDTFSSDRKHAISHGKNANGRQARRAGQLKAGYDADMIAISKSPLENIEILTDPDNVTHVWKAGVLYKSPPISFV